MTGEFTTKAENQSTQRNSYFFVILRVLESLW